MKKHFSILLMLLGSTIIAFSQTKQGGCPGNGGCELPLPTPPPIPNPADFATSSGVVSADPNELLGPTGFDTLRWVSINDILPYTVFFENDPEFAMAAAQKVNISLDFPQKTLMTKFGLGAYSFANMSFPIEDSPNMYSTRMDLRDSMKIYVDLTAGLDVEHRQAFWRFSSIDPDNGYAPWQVDRGMLPVNDSTHVGEGFVTFHIKPDEDMQTGDTISLMANIVFDQNDTIPTNRWCVTVDAGNPTSKVIGKQDKENELLYHLSFEATDDKDGSGLKRVYIYLANNLGTYEELAVCPADTTIAFPIEGGRQYKFYSLAEDNVGNREALKEEPDLVINLNVAPTDLAISDSTFRDDIEQEGFIAELSSIDTENEMNFTYTLAEGEGAVHNDLFMVDGKQLKAKQRFMCAKDTCYSIRLSTTDEGGLSYSKAFKLTLKNVLEKPKTDTLRVDICEGDIYEFHGMEYEKSGEYHFSKSNEFMCDSTFLLILNVKPIPTAPTLTIENGITLVSSAEKGNRWYKDGELIKDFDAQRFTPTESGIYHVAQSNGSCESQPSNRFYANISNQSDLTLSLAEGWTWISSNLAGTEKRDPKNLLAPIINDVEQFTGATQKLVADPTNGLVGDLKKVEPSEAYKIKVSEPTSLDLSGVVTLPDEVNIALAKGWNWIGYVPTANMVIADALRNHAPQENDMIKGLNAFATYTGGKWIGTLITLNAGEGYMYYSGTGTSFKYPYSRFTEITEYSAEQAKARFTVAPWQYDSHKYPDNMGMIADVIAEGGKTLAGVYTIGAFCGDECRGVGEYIGDQLFITIHGNSEDAISFKAIENATGNEYTIAEVAHMAESIGTMQSPYLLHIGKTTDINGIATKGSYNIYPNPVRTTLYINGDTDNITGLRIIANSGAIVDSDYSYNAESGLNISHLADGNYILGIITKSGIVYKRFIKVGS